MAACCATTSTTRMVVINTSYRMGGKSRTIPSTQLSSSSRCNNYHHHRHRHHQSFDSIPTRMHVTSSLSSSSSSRPTLLFNNNNPSPILFSPIVSSTTTSSSSSRQHQESRRNYCTLVASVLFTFTLGIFSSTTLSENNNDPLSSPSSSRSGSGSSNKNNNNNNAAEKDIQRLEEDSLKNPYEVSVDVQQGARWTMEDAYTIENGGRFVAVFDGHGGSEVSSMLREQLYTLYRKQLSKLHGMEKRRKERRREDTNNNNNSDDQTVRGGVLLPSISCQVGAIKGALEDVERRVLKVEELVYQGSTAVCVLVHVDEDGGRTLLSANIGDSRAVLSRNGKAVELTRDHKPSDEQEKARIRAMGEDVEWDPYGQLYRVRDLSLSRAIGDRFAKPAVSSEAEIKNFRVSDDDDEFIVLASDGLWDVMTSQEAVDYVHQSLRTSDESSHEEYVDISESKIAKRVAIEALERGSADNVCVLVVWLRQSTSKK